MRWTRWPRAISAAPSRSKNRDIGPCRKRNERCRSRTAKRGLKSFIAAGSRGIKGRAQPAVAPALAPEAKAFEEVDRAPVEERLSEAERGDRPRVEPGPRDKGVAPAHRPDLDPGCRPRA